MIRQLMFGLSQEQEDKNGKLYLRYNHHGADFVLIFSVEKRFYRLISAFPVFYTNEKENFDKDYRKYAWSYFDT